jgi:hypothetical protein
MAHELRFTPSEDGFKDRSQLEDVVRKYVEHTKMDVSDMLDFVLDPLREDRLQDLADWASTWGSRDDLYDIGKFGYWDCENCDAEELDIWTFRDDCDEDEDEDEE